MNKLITAALLCAMPTLALANSNCDNPKNDFDDLYCLNKVYLQADKDLNTSYGKLMKKLDGNGKALLKKGQLAWISSRNNECSYTDGRGFFVNLACATSTTIERLQFLDDRYRECVSSGCQNCRLK